MREEHEEQHEEQRALTGLGAMSLPLLFTLWLRRAT